MAEAVAQPRVRVRRCGPFLLGRRIGAGGMAAVFAARQEGIAGGGRLVAVKIMSTFLADDPRAQQMFVREASIATRLEHPNVVRVYDVGDAGGELYLAMELVHGATLAGVVREAAAPLPLPVVVRVVAEVARGLHAAHELRAPDGSLLQLIHQDVSPQNVMLGYDGTVKLLDFGVARLAAVDGSRTATVRGKPTYLAPEQIRGERLDRRTDVFALGIVLHELLSGQRLFARDTVAESFAALLAGAEIPDVREARPEVPAALAEVAARALQRQPEARFESADDVRRALAAAAAVAGVAAVEPEELGAWLRSTLPPSWSLAEVEREISSGSMASGRDVAELPTAPGGAVVVAPERDAESAQLEPPTQTTTSSLAPAGVPRGAPWLPIFVVGVAGVVGVTAWQLGVRRVEPAVTDAPAVSEANTVEPPAEPPSAPEAPTSAVEPTPSVVITSPERTAPPVAPRTAAAIGAPLPTAAVPVPPASASAGASAAPSGAVAQEQGRIGVWSNVSGKVSIDGAAYGDSPLTGVAVAPGTHTVSVSTPGGQQTQTVTVQPGQYAKLRFVF